MGTVLANVFQIFQFSFYKIQNRLKNKKNKHDEWKKSASKDSYPWT